MRTPALSNFPRIHTFAISIVFTLLIAPSIVAQSQSTTGTIQGTVVDANSAAVPDANVEIKNLDTNISRSFTTDDEGRFKALLLHPGKYSVTVTKQGFGTPSAEVELTVGQTLPITIPLAPAGVEGNVTVTNPTVDTVKTEAST